jgi:hypothetical protein
MTNDRNQSELSGQQRPIVPASASQQSGHFGIIASNKVEAAETPILLDRCVIGQLETNLNQF